MLPNIKYIIGLLVFSAATFFASADTQEIEVGSNGGVAFTFEIPEPDSGGVYFQFLITNASGTVYENWDYSNQPGFGLQRITGSYSLSDFFVGSEGDPSSGDTYYYGSLLAYFNFATLPAGTYTIEVFSYDTIEDFYAL